MPAVAICPVERNEIPREPGFSLIERGTGHCLLEIWGAFNPGWLGNFTAGLARKGINILRGEAEKLTPSVWTASFELQPADFDPGCRSVDFLALAGGRTIPADSFGLRLSQYSLKPDANDPNAVYVEIYGKDKTGFLVRVLKQFSLFSLFPTKMLIDTKGGEVFDRFWIKGIGASKPSPEALAGIKRALDGLIGC